MIWIEDEKGGIWRLENFDCFLPLDEDCTRYAGALATADEPATESDEVIFTRAALVMAGVVRRDAAPPARRVRYQG